jgi:hypothetical protein
MQSGEGMGEREWRDEGCREVGFQVPSGGREKEVIQRQIEEN